MNLENHQSVIHSFSNIFNNDHLREFLAYFKTVECLQKKQHDYQNCEYYHQNSDRRRNPYLKHSIIYTYKQCKIINCNYNNCCNSHNQYQVNYHPLMYLTQKCLKFYDCTRKFCPFLHQNQRDQLHYLNQFFRFDLNTFKTKLCPIQSNFYGVHDVKICLYYHNKNDYRRPNVYEYQHIVCDSYDRCQEKEKCKYSHNKIQQLYHPSRYKSKFCQHYPNQISKCQYQQFCSFAHSTQQIAINLIHLKALTDQFFINQFKTVWCPFTKDHQRKSCVYAHNIQDFRRNPNQYKYAAQRCPNWIMAQNIKSIEKAGCKDKMNCKKCHGWKELDFHPKIFNKNKKYKQKQSYHLNTFLWNPEIDRQHLIKKIQCKQIDNMMKDKIKIQPILPHKNFINNSMIGAPFFQQDTLSTSSLTTKAKSGFISGSQSDITSKKSERRRSYDSFDCRRDCSDNQVKIVSNLPKMYSMQYRQIFGEFDIMKIKKERARSCHKIMYINYSKSLRDLLEDTKILDKLKTNKYTEIKILNLKESSIEKLDFLQAFEKKVLITKLKSFFTQNQNITYSTEVCQFFTKHDKYYIIQKMLEKKVSEDKFLNLHSEEIQSFSFIEEEDKKILSDFIKEYNNNKEFTQIKDIIEETIIRNQ